MVNHIGRNQPCPCGSGKKFKQCCIPVYVPPEPIKPRDEFLPADRRELRKLQATLAAFAGLGMR